MSKTDLLEWVDSELYEGNTKEDLDRCLTLWDRFEETPNVPNAVNALFAEAQWNDGFYPGEDSESHAIELLVEAARKETLFTQNLSRF